MQATYTTLRLQRHEAPIDSSTHCLRDWLHMLRSSLSTQRKRARTHRHTSAYGLLVTSSIGRTWRHAADADERWRQRAAAAAARGQKSPAAPAEASLTWLALGVDYARGLSLARRSLGSYGTVCVCCNRCCCHEVMKIDLFASTFSKYSH